MLYSLQCEASTSNVNHNMTPEDMNKELRSTTDRCHSHQAPQPQAQQPHAQQPQTQQRQRRQGEDDGDIRLSVERQRMPGLHTTPCWLLLLVMALMFHKTSAHGQLDLHIVRYNLLPTSHDTPKSTEQHSLRLCLSHYQSVVDTKAMCTFGSRRTAPFSITNSGRSSMPEERRRFDFPFTFAWPGAFSLVIEAYKEDGPPPQTVNLSSDHIRGGGQRHSSDGRKSTNDGPLYQLVEQRSLPVDTTWTTEKHIVKGSDGSRAEIEIKFRVTCAPNWFGPKCRTFCEARNGTNRHFTCEERSGERLCDEGWKGRNCDKAICTPGCLGVCHTPHTCQCPHGFHGRLCDECIRYPGCQHGTCDKPFGCECDEGWGGLFCNQDLNYCTHNSPCDNGATCTNTGAGHYTCACGEGFTGTNCEVHIDNCLLQPCTNGGGTSSSSPSEVVVYTCDCLIGYSGRHCQVRAKTCDDRPCQNGATCTTMGDDGFVCLCPRGFSGELCDMDVNECESNPCNNGGSCVDARDGYQCVCPLGFEGDRCEQNIDDCSVGACLNGGTCIDHMNSFQCHCPIGWSGALCQTHVNNCLARPCANGGRCIDHAHGHTCRCKAGFEGDDCAVDVDECKSNPCRNAGMCTSGLNAYTCKCPMCHSGVDCENRDEDCLLELGLLFNVTTMIYKSAQNSDGLQTTLLIFGLPVAVVVILLLVALLVVTIMLYRHSRLTKLCQPEGQMSTSALQYDRPPAYSMEPPPSYETEQNQMNDGKRMSTYGEDYKKKRVVQADYVAVKMPLSPTKSVTPLSPLAASRLVDRSSSSCSSSMAAPTVSTSCSADSQGEGDRQNWRQQHVALPELQGEPRGRRDSTIDASTLPPSKSSAAYSTDV